MTYRMKKIFATLLLILSINVTSKAQIFILDDELEGPRIQNEAFYIDNPLDHGSGEDWYVPVGSGTLLLAGLAGAYLVDKKRKK